MIKTFLNPEGHQNPINGSKVTAILLKGWILPVGGASAVEGLQSTGLPHLVLLGYSGHSIMAAADSAVVLSELDVQLNGNPISTFPPCYAFQMIWTLGGFSL